MTNALLFKMNFVASPTCAHCLEVETIMHAFFKCSHVVVAAAAAAAAAAAGIRVTIVV